MKKDHTTNILRAIFLGKRYSELSSINDQIRFITINSIVLASIVPLAILGVTSIDRVRSIIDFSLVFTCVITIALMHSKIPLKYVPIFVVTTFGVYCCYLLYTGDLGLWAAIWIFSFPPIVIFLCQMTVGVIESIIILVVSVLFLYTPISRIAPDNNIRIRFLGVYLLILIVSIIYEAICILKDRKEEELNTALVGERDMIQTMKDNINQGIFLMDRQFNILPQYSLPLVSMLSYHDAELTGKNFLDIISSSFNHKQLEILKGYFNMVFNKEKSKSVLETANPISEFKYEVNNSVKYLGTRFQLIEHAKSDNRSGTVSRYSGEAPDSSSESVIIGIIRDISREKEIESELLAQKEVQEIEMKNMFDILKVDPMVFQSFIEDTESNFNSINALLKDRDLSEKQVVIKTFQYVHAIKSNAIILDLENLVDKLHVLEEYLKSLSDKTRVFTNDILTLAIKIESFMQEVDSYTAITKRISAFKSSNRMDTILLSSLSKAVEKLSGEARKKVQIKASAIDLNIMESKLRKPIKEILYQCVRNSISHGIEIPDERIKKNKNPQGLIKFSIRNVDGKAEVIFSDDGRGLDWDKIRGRYFIKNPGAQADKNTLLGAVFSPEFSTADEINSAAGWGIGLSLVKDLVKENNGRINVNSTEAGLALKFCFPLN